MDQTETATAMVRAQMVAMDAARYEVGVKRADGRMVPLTLSASQVLRRGAWLVGENRQGADIFIRPAGWTTLVLLDDIDDATVARLSMDGLGPAVVVETSPANHQAWVRLSPEPIAPALATAAARELAERYDGDLNSATWRHYGRLAGFENRKPKHQRLNGTYPLVRLRATAAGVAPGGLAVLDAARARLVAHAPAAQAPVSRIRMRVVPVGRPVDGTLSPLGHLYRREARRLWERYPTADLSRLDWMIVLSLARAFRDATAEELARAMVEGSPELVERKAGHVADYVARTVGKALAVIAMERQHRTPNAGDEAHE